MSYVERCTDLAFTLYKGYSKIDLLKLTYTTHLVFTFNAFVTDTILGFH
jgi:hypothetical protein